MVFLYSAQSIQLSKAPLGAYRGEAGSLQALGLHGRGLSVRTGLTSAVPLPQEIKSNKTVLHLAVQAANPTLVQLLLELPQGDLRAFVNMKVGPWARVWRLRELAERAVGCWESCGL